jgi:two-component system nitrogen regulation response regulator NtrX
MSGPAVLVIDDEPDMGDTFAMVLEPIGYEVVSVDSGEAALAAIRGRRFDLALTDFMMPGLDGTQTLDALKAADPELPVIVVTGFVTDEMFADCSSHGAFAVVKKPFDVNELRALVERARRR